MSEGAFCDGLSVVAASVSVCVVRGSAEVVEASGDFCVDIFTWEVEAVLFDYFGGIGFFDFSLVAAFSACGVFHFFAPEGKMSTTFRWVVLGPLKGWQSLR